GDLQRAETELAGELRAEVVALAALPAGQRGGGAEGPGGGGGGFGGGNRHGEASPLIFPGDRSGPRPELAPVPAASPGYERTRRDGCRGFAGPVPPPLWMSNLKLSADPDRVRFVHGSGWKSVRHCNGRCGRVSIPRDPDYIAGGCHSRPGRP